MTDRADPIRVLFVCTGNSVRWGYEDPAAAEGNEAERLAVFRRVFAQLGERIHQFVPIALHQDRLVSPA